MELAVNLRWTRQALEDRVIDTCWKLRPGPPVTPYHTWPFDRTLLSQAVIRWPARYAWPAAAKWLDHLRVGLSELVAIVPAEIEQPYPGVMPFEIALPGRTVRIAVDYADRSAIHEACAAECAVYFKMQYAQPGYGRRHVVPGGYVPADSALYAYLGRLRAMRDRCDYDCDVYGRFSLDAAPDVRRHAHALLSRQRHFHYEGSLERTRYSRYLREVARARICIDLPGNGDFCFRLIDYLAIGACIIGRRHGTALHVPLIDGEQIVYAKDDLSDLVDLCRQYLADDERREAISRNARRLFDDCLHRRPLAAYYLHTSLHLSA
jgi:hypothetical protein